MATTEKRYTTENLYIENSTQMRKRQTCQLKNGENGKISELALYKKGYQSSQ